MAAVADSLPRLAQSRLLPALCIGLALLWMVLELVQTAWSWITPSADLELTETLQISADGARSRIPLASFHLFGRAVDPAAAAYANAPDTTLKLNLKGTSSHNDQNRARAVIADDNQVEKVYKVGDLMDSGVRVQAIYPDRVVLNAAGRIEVLRLIQAGRGLASASSGAPAQAPAAISTGSGGLIGLNTQPSYTPGSVNPSVVSAPVDWESVRRQAIADPNSMAKAFSVLPVMVDGKLAGVRLSSNQYGQQLANAGLQPDDIVTAVNGRKLDSVEAGLNALESLRTAGAVTITINRNGSEKTLPAIRMQP